MLAAVILSGGASRRMGSPKALVSYQGRPFLEHLLAVTRHSAIGVRRAAALPATRSSLAALARPGGSERVISTLSLEVLAI